MNIYFEHFFPKSGHFFKNFEKEHSRIPPSPSSYAPGALGLHGCDRTVLDKKVALFKGSLE